MVISGGFPCRFTLDLETGKKQAPKVIQFLPSISFIYQWANWEVLGTPSLVELDCLRSLWEENLITPKGKYEEDYTLEVPNVNEKVCYVNHEDKPN